MDGKLLFELKRKSIHLVSFVYILLYYLINENFSHRTAILSLTFILIFLAGVEFIKIKLGRKIPLFHFFYRDNERDRISGSIYLIIGAIIAFSAFEFEIATAALLMMMFGDMAAALFGITLGKHWIKSIPNTSWEGVIAEFVIDVIIGMIILQNFAVILIMAVVATFAETVLTSIDDNLSVPVLSGFAGQVSIMLMRIFGFI